MNMSGGLDNDGQITDRSARRNTAYDCGIMRIDSRAHEVIYWYKYGVE
jgi:hypothetical protein